MCIVGSSIYVHCTHTYLVFLEHAGNDVRQIILSLLKKLLNGSSPHCRFHLFSIHISIYVCVYGLHTILHIVSIYLLNLIWWEKRLSLCQWTAVGLSTYKICFRLKGMSAVGKTKKYRSDLSYIIVTKVIFLNHTKLGENWVEFDFKKREA